MTETDNFFKNVLRLRRVDAIDLIYDTLDTLLLDGSFDQVRCILVEAIQHVSVLPIGALLSILRVTIQTDVLQSERKKLVHCIRQRLIVERDPNIAKRLLHGLI